VLYALAALVLAAGTFWWFRSVPSSGAEPQAVAWRDTVELLVPDRSDQLDAQTVLLGPGMSGSIMGDASTGRYRLLLACAGRGQVRVQVGTPVDDGARAVPCGDEPVAVTWSVVLDDGYLLAYSAEVRERAAFRWQLLPD
jgi:hypothetical protein